MKMWWLWCTLLHFHIGHFVINQHQFHLKVWWCKYNKNVVPVNCSEINCWLFRSLGVPNIYVALNDGGTFLSRFWPPWSVGTHRSGLKGSKQSTLVPFHVKAIKHELRVKAGPVEHSSKGNLIGRLETKLWGHLCLVPPLLVLLQPVLQRQRHREQVNCCVSQELLCDSVYFSSPGTHLTDGPFASCFIYLMPSFPFKTCISTETKEKRTSLSQSIQRVAFKVGNTFCWMTAEIWCTQTFGGTILLTHPTSSEVLNIRQAA